MESELVTKVKILKDASNTSEGLDAYVKVDGIGLYKDKDCAQLLTKADFESWGVTLTGIGFQRGSASSTRGTVIDLSSQNQLRFTSAYGYGVDPNYNAVIEQEFIEDQPTWVASMVGVRIVALYE